MSGTERDASTTPSSLPALSQFKDSLHSSFVVRDGDGGAVTLTLDEITTGRSRDGWESYSLVFAGPRPAAFGQGLFDVEHATLGSFVLFLVAVQTDGDGQQYEAVFNRRST
jgi:hypothetical protein